MAALQELIIIQRQFSKKGTAEMHLVSSSQPKGMARWQPLMQLPESRRIVVHPIPTVVLAASKSERRFHAGAILSSLDMCFSNFVHKGPGQLESRSCDCTTSTPLRFLSPNHTNQTGVLEAGNAAECSWLRPADV